MSYEIFEKLKRGIFARGIFSVFLLILLLPLAKASVVLNATDFIGFNISASEVARIVSGGLIVSGGWVNATNAAFNQICLSGNCKTGWPANLVGGTGSANYIAKWQDSSTLTSSIIYEIGGNVGIGTTSPLDKLDVRGNRELVHISGNTYNVDGWGKYVVVGEIARGGTWPTYIPVGSVGLEVNWDSDALFVGLRDYGSNRKDAVIGWGDDSDDNLRIQFNGADRILITSAGNVGIGTTSPENSAGWNRVLDVYGDYHSRIITRTTNIRTAFTSHNSGFFGAPAGGIIGTETSHPLSFITGGSSRVTIDTSGNVGIGTTSPVTTLDVNGNALVRSTMTIGQSSLFSGNNPRNLNVLGEIKSFGSGAGLRMEDRSYTTDPSKEWVIYPNGNYLRFWSGLRGDLVAINYDTGYVGIGTTAPAAKLHVVGAIRADDVIYSESDSSYDPATELRTWGINKPYASGKNNHLYIEWGANAADGGNMYITDHWNYVRPLYVQTGPIHLMAGNTYGIFVNTNGNVGIGTSNPGEKLEVAGNIQINGGAATGTNVIKGLRFFYAGDETTVSSTSTSPPGTKVKYLTALFDSQYGIKPRYINVIARLWNSGSYNTYMKIYIDGTDKCTMSLYGTTKDLRRCSIDVSSYGEGTHSIDVYLYTDSGGTAYNDFIEFYYVE